jgi:hypothetical protein
MQGRGLRHSGEGPVDFRQVRWGISLGALASAVLGAAPAYGHKCKPGEEVEYKAVSWPEAWEKGVCLRELPGGTQVLIRQKPTQFFPEGSERAYALDDVRPAGQAAPQAAPGQAADPQPAALVTPAPAPRAGQIRTTGREGAAGTGLMSEADVLGFLKQRLGEGDPFMNPRREAVLQELREEVMRRGVSFRKQAIGPFADELGKYGALSNVTGPLNDNFGPPAKQAELMGKWELAKVGGTTMVTRGGDLYQRQEYAGLAGSITIDPGGTYVWDSPSGMLRGNWRAATPEEMAKSDKGGEGVVLLAAKDGADWLVHKRTEEGPEGTGIMIRDLATRNLRERGVR